MNLHPDLASPIPLRPRACFTACLLAFGLLAAPGARAETATVHVPKAAVGTAFNAALASTRIVIDDYGSKHGSSWHENHSYVLLPNGQRHDFNVDEYKFSVTKFRQLKYYVDDLQSSEIKAYVDGSLVRLNIGFESQGEEIKAKCVRRRLGKWGECSLPMERDVQLNNTRIEVALKPAAYAGSISYAGNPSVKFAADVHIENRLCNAFKGICGWIQGKIKGALTDAIEQSVRNNLNSSANRQAVANAVRHAAALKGLIDPAWKVTAISSKGSDFLVTVQRPDQIGANAVSQLKLKTARREITNSCPAKVDFAATIHTRYTIKGKGRLDYENGKHGNPFSWGAKKNTDITSHVSRQVKGKPGQTRKGWVQMSVNWKGTDGKTYEKRSNKSAFVVHCRGKVAAGGLKQ